MIFPTLDFLLFFLVVFALVWLASPHPVARKAVLLGASYFFYGYWDWRFTFLLAASTIVNWGAGWLLAAEKSEIRRKWIAAIAIALNLTTLGFFKYYGFFIESLDGLLRSIGWQRDLPFIEVILPVGISFFVFQGISYVIDAYRRDLPRAYSLLDVAVYKSLFPQLVAGPIVRAADFMPQLERPPRRDAVFMSMALLLILWGLFKKAIVANYLATELVDPAFLAPSEYGALDLLLAIYAYAVQIYCDFSAYSDIAIGVAALLGYHFMRNFDQPYRAQSLQDFWRRWHISLSSWLRDYLYIPLGGNRRGPVRTYVNLMITMLLGGIWHGAAWKFVLWGALHGGGLAIERALGLGDRPHNTRWSRIVCTLVIFHFVCFAWIFFRASSMENALGIFEGLARWSEPLLLAKPYLLVLIALGIAINFTPRNLLDRLEIRFQRWPVVLQGLAAGLVVVLIETMGGDGVAPFIYFQF
jgi:alginate O-acetyltransferase complex protein AlgI